MLTQDWSCGAFRGPFALRTRRSPFAIRSVPLHLGPTMLPTSGSLLLPASGPRWAHAPTGPDAAPYDSSTPSPRGQMPPPRRLRHHHHGSSSQHPQPRRLSSAMSLHSRLIALDGAVDSLRKRVPFLDVTPSIIYFRVTKPTHACKPNFFL